MAAILTVRGDDGNLIPIPAIQGTKGVGIASITRTAGNGAPGTTDTYTITLEDGRTSDFTVYNGRNGVDGEGSGSGDMLAYIYDPTGKAQDIFKYTDDKIAAIPTPDVSGQIGTHNTSTTAHSDIRNVANAAKSSADAAQTAANTAAASAQTAQSTANEAKTAANNAATAAQTAQSTATAAQTAAQTAADTATAAQGDALAAQQAAQAAQTAANSKATMSEVDAAISAALAGGAKIATGSYTGTNVYGSGNPNRLTFGFVPKVVFVATVGSGTRQAIPWVYGSTTGLLALGASSNTLSASTVTLSWSGNTISWYGSSANGQMNGSNQTFNYVAIG